MPRYAACAVAGRGMKPLPQELKHPLNRTRAVESPELRVESPIFSVRIFSQASAARGPQPGGQVSWRWASR